MGKPEMSKILLVQTLFATGVMLLLSTYALAQGGALPYQGEGAGKKPTPKAEVQLENNTAVPMFPTSPTKTGKEAISGAESQNGESSVGGSPLPPSGTQDDTPREWGRIVTDVMVLSLLLAILAFVVVIMRRTLPLQDEGTKSPHGMNAGARTDKTDNTSKASLQTGSGLGRTNESAYALNTKPAGCGEDDNILAGQTIPDIEKKLREMNATLNDIIVRAKNIMPYLAEEYLHTWFMNLKNIVERLNASEGQLITTVSRLESATSLTVNIFEKEQIIKMKEQEITQKAKDYIDNLATKDDEIIRLKQTLSDMQASCEALIKEASLVDDPYDRLVPSDVLSIFGLSKRDLKSESSLPLFPAVHALCAFVEWAEISDGSRFAAEISKMDKILSASVLDEIILQGIRNKLEEFVASEVSSALQGKYTVKWNFVGENFNQTLHFSKGEGLRIVRVLTPLVEVNGKILTRAEVECQ